ncbi:hypothetical protein MC885_010474 [Smutsia gigantea]|nr:hypothetical protein MC885_010474 [Smutsia gigantea]
MEGEPSRLEIHTPIFDKKKKKYSVHKDRHQRRSHDSFRDSPLASETSPLINKSKKRRKDFQHLVSSPVKKSEACDETEKATCVPKKKKKRRNSARGVDRETGVMYVLVDKKNTENKPENFRRDVDVVYVNMSRGQKSEEPEANRPHAVTKSHKKESGELHGKVKEKKNKKRRRRAASCDASQGSPCASITLAPPESHKQDSLLSVGLEGETAQPPLFAHRSKVKKKKKRKLSSNQEFAAVAAPESPENMHSEGAQVLGEVGPAEGSEGFRSRKKKSKKRKRRSSVGSVAVSGADFSVLSPSLEDTLFDSLDGNGNLTEDSARPRPQGGRTQAYLEEAHRLETTNEEESNLELAKDSETKYLSEDSRASGDSDVDLDSAVRQLQEFIPDIKDRAATTIKRMYRDDLGRFKEFKAQGKGIARPWKLVYYRAKKMFDVNNYKGRYSKGDMEKLKIYQALHGNDWKKIGEMVARSSLSVALKFSQISSQRNHGAWSKTETQKLIKAVEEVILKKMTPQELEEVDSRLQENPEGCLSIVREKLYKGISWVEVEAKVETRNWMQCKSKWLYEINVEDANEIDWEDLAGTIGHDVKKASPPNEVYHRLHLKMSRSITVTPQSLSSEIIDYLYETSLPLLKEKLEKKMEKKGTEVQSPAAPKQVFLFRDIFHGDDDSEVEDMHDRS